MPWREELRRKGILQRFPHHSLVYYAGIDPPVPPEYELPGIVGLTFRMGLRDDGDPLYATLLDVAAAIRLGHRLHIGAAEAIAMVDSHERIHVALQLDYERLKEVPPDLEEMHTHFVDEAYRWAQGF